MLKTDRRVAWPVLVLVAGFAMGAPLRAKPFGIEGFDRSPGYSLFPAASHRGLFDGLVKTIDRSRLTGEEPVVFGREPLDRGERIGPFRRIRLDLIDLVRAPAHFDRRAWRRTALAAAAIAATAAFDDPIRDAVLADTASSRRFAERIRPLGQEAGIGFMALAWSWGKLAKRPRLAAMGADGLEALAVSTAIVTPSLKLLLGRRRPRDELGRSFFQGAASFPSGESTEAFALAAVIAAHSRSRLVDALAWSTAGLIGWERMRLDGHWASDVVAGAFVGSTIARWVVRRNRGFRAEPRMRWSARVGDGSYGVALRWAF